MIKTLWNTSGTCPECGSKQLYNAVEICDCEGPCDTDCNVETHYQQCICGYKGEYNAQG